MGKLYELLYQHVPSSYEKMTFIEVINYMVQSIRDDQPEVYLSSLALMNETTREMVAESVTPEQSVEVFMRGLMDCNFFAFIGFIGEMKNG